MGNTVPSTYTVSGYPQPVPCWNNVGTAFRRFQNNNEREQIFTLLKSLTDLESSTGYVAKLPPVDQTKKLATLYEKWQHWLWLALHWLNGSTTITDSCERARVWEALHRIPPILIFKQRAYRLIPRNYMTVYNNSDWLHRCTVVHADRSNIVRTFAYGHGTNNRMVFINTLGGPGPTGSAAAGSRPGRSGPSSG
jgi:hypothetical protein